MSVYVSLFKVAIHVNFTSEFRENFEAITYISDLYYTLLLLYSLYIKRVFALSRECVAHTL